MNISIADKNVKKYTPSFGRKFFPWYRVGGKIIPVLLLTTAIITPLFAAKNPNFRAIGVFNTAAVRNAVANTITSKAADYIVNQSSYVITYSTGANYGIDAMVWVPTAIRRDLIGQATTYFSTHLANIISLSVYRHECGNDDHENCSETLIYSKP